MHPASDDESLPVDAARWLVTSAGLDTVAAAADLLDEGADELAVATKLRLGSPDSAFIATALGAALARRRAREHFSDAERLLFTRASLEQASRPDVSSWRARRYAGAASVVDACSGVGGDAMAIARHAPVVAIDASLPRCLLLAHNVRVSSSDVRVVTGDVLTPPVASVGLLHVDPGRRRDGRRIRTLADTVPPVPAILARWEAADGVGLVLSPAVDLDDQALPADAQLEFVQVDDALVEAMCWTGDLREDHHRSTATLLRSSASAGSVDPTDCLIDTIHLDPTAPRLLVGAPGEWLVEVAPAAVRARCHDQIGATIDARRIGERRALLTADVDPGSSPWWHRWHVEAVLPARMGPVRAWLKGAEVLPIEIATHGLQVDPVAWWRGIGRPARGPRGRRLHLVRTDKGACCIATRAVDAG